jgi:sec-independent protein translocase protein TatA
MFGLGISELMVIFVIALVVFGPKRLPALGRSVGRAIAEFKKASQEFKDSVKEEMKEMEKIAQVEELKTMGQEIAAVGYEQTVVLKGVAEYEQAEKGHANGAA